MTIPPAPANPSSVLQALAHAGYGEAETAAAVGQVFPGLAALDLLACIVTPGGFPAAQRPDLATDLGGVSRYSAAEIGLALDAAFPPAPAPTPLPPAPPPGPSVPAPSDARFVIGNIHGNSFFQTMSLDGASQGYSPGIDDMAGPLGADTVHAHLYIGQNFGPQGGAFISDFVGSAPVRLVSIPDAVTALAVDPDHNALYLGTMRPGAIWRCDLIGQGLTRIVAPAGDLLGMTLDAASQILYWLEGDQNTGEVALMAAGADGAGPRALIPLTISLNNAMNLQIDRYGSTLYWVQLGNMMRYAIGRGPPEILYALGLTGSYTQIAFHPGTDQFILSDFNNDTASGVIYTGLADGSGIHKVATGLDLPSGLAFLPDPPHFEICFGPVYTPVAAEG